MNKPFRTTSSDQLEAFLEDDFFLHNAGKDAAEWADAVPTFSQRGVQDPLSVPAVELRTHVNPLNSPRSPIAAAPSSNNKPSTSKPVQRNGHQRSHVRRYLSNVTYLRRLHLTSQQAVVIIPELVCQASLAASPKRSFKTSPPKTRTDIILANAAGQLWRATCESVTTPTGRISCRLLGGWAQFCRDNGVEVGDDVVLERGGECGVLVRVEKGRH